MNKECVLKGLLIVLGSVLVSCGFAQDPLKGLSDELRQAGPPGKKVDPSKPLPSNSVLLEVPTATFVEGETKTIVLSARVLLPGYEAPLIVIENLNDFAGATFDAATGDFTWTPAVGTTQGKNGKFLELSASASANPIPEPNSDRRALIRSESAYIAIEANPKSPTVDILGFASTLYELDSYAFTVNVTDVSSLEVQPPQLVFSQPTAPGRISLAPWVRINSQSYSPQTKTWTFLCKVLVNSTDVSPDLVTAGLQVLAVSAFGKWSETVEVEAELFTALQDPVASWATGKTLDATLPTNIEFSVYNPQGEGVLTLESSSVKLPEFGALNCQPAGASLRCVFTYTPLQKNPNVGETQDIEFSVITVNSSSKDTSQIVTPFKLNFKVGEA